ncbi:Carboxypeptidase D [Bertholletia excelsa]
MASAATRVPLFILLSVYILSINSFITRIKSLDTYTESDESDRVKNLPGQPSTPPVSHFSGYITVNQSHGRALFYWFFEAQSQPSEKPLLLWFNGGPGCSSIGYGAAVELGPLRVSEQGAGLEFNTNSWNKEANLLFVESPVGVGFSYTNTSSDLSMIDDGFVAEDAYNFLVNWMTRFPKFRTHDVFLSGESYAGHYVPQLAEVIYDRNKDTTYPRINLKGFIVGNPETDDSYDYKGMLEYAWSHSVISDPEFETAKEVCNFNLSEWSNECNTAMNVVFGNYREVDIYNIYAPICLLNSSTSSSTKGSDVSSSKARNLLFKKIRILGGYDPCYSQHTDKYFNRQDVQTALHSNTRGNSQVKWQVCSDYIFGSYIFNISSVLPIYTKLIRGGLKIWIYSGDTDGRVPIIGSRYCVEALGLPLKSPWRTWYHDHQVGGRIVEYEGLTLVTVRGAGHLVPLNKPSEALALIHSYLSGEAPPAHRW